MDLSTIKMRPVEVRQSAVNCFLACRRKWLLKYRLGIQLRGEQITEAADIGTIYHRMKQVGPDRMGEVKTWVRQRQNDLMARADKGEDLDGTLVRVANSLTESYHIAEVMARIFWERFPQPEYLTRIASEVEVSFPDRNTGITLGGRLDQIVLQKGDNPVYWIRDDKSTGRNLDTIFGGLGWGIQPRFYRILADHYLRDVYGDPVPTVRGFIMDGIVRPGIKLCRTDVKNAKEWGVTEEEAYLRRVRDWYKEQEDNGKDIVLSKAMVFNEPLWPPEVTKIVGDIADADMRSERGLEETYFDSDFPRDVSRQACYQWERQCEYHDLCSSCPKNWDDLFEHKYKIAEEPQETNQKGESE